MENRLAVDFTKTIPTIGEILPMTRKVVLKPGRDKELASHFEHQACREAIKRLSSQLGARYTQERSSLSRYQVYSKNGQQVVFDKIKSLMAELPAFIDAGKNLVLYGGCGTGKDHLVAALLYAAAGLGYDAQWVSCLQFFGQSRDRIGSGQDQEQLIRRLAAPEVLGMSDPIPPKGDTKDWDTQLMYRVLDARNRAMKPTWVTANAKDETELMDQLSVPVWDRLKDGALIMGCFWPSFRRMAK